MLVRRRVFQTIPILIALTLVVAWRIVGEDPWRTNTLLGWLGADVYYPRRLSFLGDGVMVALSIMADAGITIGCGLIAYCYWIYRNHSIQLSSEAIRLIAGSFALLGATHLANMATMFAGVYLLDLLIRSSATAACCVTAAYTARALLSLRRR